MKIHHVGYLVKHLEKALGAFISLGYEQQSEVVYDPLRDVRICFLKKDGYLIELVSPTSKESVVSSLSKRIGNTPYHICYEADDFFQDLEALEAGGFMRIDEIKPAPAIENRNVCFLQSAHLGMIELLGEKT